MEEGEGDRIATNPPLNFQKSLFPFIFFGKEKLNIIVLRTDINLNVGLLIFLLKTYNLIGVFLEFYVQYHGSSMTMRSLLKSYLYHRARSH